MTAAIVLLMFGVAGLAFGSLVGHILKQDADHEDWPA